MTTRSQKLLLAAFGTALGVLLSAGCLVLLAFVNRPAKRISPGESAALQARLDRNPRGLFLFDEKLSYRLKPNFRGIRVWTRDARHETNSLGLLGREEVNPDPRVRKIVFLGDSITYGIALPAEQAFVSLMQADAGADLQLFNAACPGWSLYQELLFREESLRSVPWALTVVVFTLNDLTTFEWVFDTEEEMRFAEQTRIGKGMIGALRLWGMRLGFAARRDLAPLARHHNGFLAAWDESRWRKYRAEVIEPFLARAAGTRLVFVAIPTAFQMEALSRHAPEEKVLLPQAILARICKEHGLPFIDATAALRSAPPAALFLDDCHLSPLGHERVARFLWPRIAASIDDPRR